MSRSRATPSRASALTRPIIARQLAFAPLVLWLVTASCAVRQVSRAISRPLAALPEGCTGPRPVDVLEHAVDLRLRLDPPALSGQGQLRLRSRRLTEVAILDADGLAVSRVGAGGRSLSFHQLGKRLCVSLPRPLGPGEEITVEMAWRVPVGGKAPRFSSHDLWAGYHTSAWMPTVQDFGQRATLTLRITTDAGLKVAASGRRVGEAPAGDGAVVHSFVLDRPSPPFLYGFAAGIFDEAVLALDGVELRALGPKGSDLDGVLALTAPMYRFLAEHAGAPFPAPAYTQVFVSGEAAQEAAGLSFLSSAYLDEIKVDPTEDWLLSHELSHQWFAWLVPCADLADFWLNEGFATFMVAAVKERRWGRAAYERELDVWHQRSRKVHAEGRDAPLSLSAPGAPPRVPADESELQPRGITYARGALVLHALRGELGDAAFWSGVRLYVQTRSGQGARSEALRSAFEAAGHRDLGPFFAKWVYAPAPDL